MTTRRPLPFARPRLSALLLLGAAGLLASCAAGEPSDGESQSSAASAAPPRVVATLKLSAYGPQLEELTRRDYDVAGVDVAASEVDLVVDPEEVPRLESEGFQVINVASTGSVAPDPDLARYARPDTVATALRSASERHPSLAETTAIGRSTQGRDILAIRITKDVGVAHPERPRILFNSMHHARELMTTEVALDTIDVLLERYGTDPKVTHWVDANEIWVVPMLNVDGNNQVWTADSFWRKNTRGCMTSGACPRGSGVDINRNYPYRFAGCNGSSASASSDSYRGPSAASEPETQAMMRLVDQTRPVFDISYHSYSELVLYPQGCTGMHADIKPVLEDIGGKMARGLPTDDGGGRTYKAGTPWEILYGVDGDDMDWMLQDFSVVPFAIELSGRGQGFRPSYAGWRDRTVTKLRSAWQLLLDRLDGSGVRGIVHEASGEPARNARVVVTSAARGTSQTRPVNPDGSFHVVLLPGDYQVTVEGSAGRAAFSRVISVGPDRVDLDVALD